MTTFPFPSSPEVTKGEEEEDEVPLSIFFLFFFFFLLLTPLALGAFLQTILFSRTKEKERRNEEERVEKTTLGPEGQIPKSILVAAASS